MAATWNDLADYLGNPDDTQNVQDAWDEAADRVNAALGVQAANVPDSVYVRALKVCGANLYRLRESQNGVAAVLDNGQTVWTSKDPMHNVRPLLKPWVLPF